MTNTPIETFTLVRHGFSEANFVQKLAKNYPNRDKIAESPVFQNSSHFGVPPEFFDIHDSLMRLTPEGVYQAEKAGEWLRENCPEFDRFYVSPHSRTLETAHSMGMNGQWRIDDRFRERCWGDMHSVTVNGESPLTEEMRIAKEQSEWYWRPPNGETLASDVRMRMASVMDTLYRKDSKNMIAVSHGEFLRVAQFVIEKMHPFSWQDMDKDPAYKVQNCMILQYTTRNPYKPDEVSKEYRWRRAICPWNKSLSWDNGEWVEFSVAKYSDDELVKLFTRTDNLFPELLRPESW